MTLRTTELLEWTGKSFGRVVRLRATLRLLILPQVVHFIWTPCLLALYQIVKTEKVDDYGARRSLTMWNEL